MKRVHCDVCGKSKQWEEDELPALWIMLLVALHTNDEASDSPGVLICDTCSKVAHVDPEDPSVGLAAPICELMLDYVTNRFVAALPAVVKDFSALDIKIEDEPAHDNPE